MARRRDRDTRAIWGFALALTTAVLVLQLPPPQCPVGAALDAYESSVTVSACKFGVTFSL